MKPMTDDQKTAACVAFFVTALAAIGLACGCSTINYYVTVLPADGGSVRLDTTINQSVPKTLTSSIPVGDSAIQAAAKAVVP